MTLPRGYQGPHDPARDPFDQARDPWRSGQMSDPVAQNLLADLVTLHEQLLALLDHHIELASLGASEPASGRVSGSGEHDSIATRALAVQHARAERDRTRKNALEELRRTKRYYQERLGLVPPRRPRVESIDYRNGGDRRVG